MILFFIAVVTWVISQAVIDGEHIIKTEYITNHASRLFSRVMVGVCVGLLNWKAGLITGLVFWGLFDQSLNIYLKRKLFQMGNTAKTDKFFTDKKWLYILSKLVALTGAVLLTLL